MSSERPTTNELLMLELNARTTTLLCMFFWSIGIMDCMLLLLKIEFRSCADGVSRAEAATFPVHIMLL